jgi:hypothetical protein
MLSPVVFRILPIEKHLGLLESSLGPEWMPMPIQIMVTRRQFSDSTTSLQLPVEHIFDRLRMLCSCKLRNSVSCALKRKVGRRVLFGW